MEKVGSWTENRERKILEVPQINAVFSGEKAPGPAVLRREELSQHLADVGVRQAGSSLTTSQISRIFGVEIE